MQDTFRARSTFTVGGQDYEIFRLDALARHEGIPVARLPYSLRILLENLLRHEDGVTVTAEDIRALATWDPAAPPDTEIAFMPARVLLQDFTGVPALADLAAMRDAVAQLGGDPKKINPLLPVELVIDHSIQVDAFGTPEAFNRNEALDYERNAERYRFIKWGRRAFRNFSATPPNVGICHQVNLEFLARVVFGQKDARARGDGGLPQAYPDTVVGTDSHTPMVNGLGVLGWGVGGIEAEAAMLGQPISMLIPRVVGFRLTGKLPEGSTATDLVLTVVELLRQKGVVGQFVEFHGPGIASLSVADRATLGNMSPEYGSTCTIFPVDAVTLDYLRLTGRSEEEVQLVEAYMKTQGLFHDENSPEPVFSDTLELDLSTVQPSLAGPRRPQDRVPLGEVRKAFHAALPSLLPPKREPDEQKGGVTEERKHGHAVGAWGEGDCDGSPEMLERKLGHEVHQLHHGSVVIAAITSCTNTSNPSVMIAAGLLAKKAVAKGLARKPWVKTSLAPGSKVVTAYYERAGLMRPLEELGFYLAGYGCTTCIGNSGPLPAEVSEAIDEQGLVVASVLSGNRNFEGRINSDVRANFLMSPPLVVAFAIAGRIDIDLYQEPLGTDADGKPVYLRDIWPSQAEIEACMREAVGADLFSRTYADIEEGDARWNELKVEASERYPWDEDSTYLRRPPYFDGMSRAVPERVAVQGARALLVLDDSVTTDHISPAGTIKVDSPAGRYLLAQGVAARDFNSYGSRRGNHEVMVRGTFANTRIRNRLVPRSEGPITRYLPTDEVMPVYDAAMRYREAGIPLIVLAGREYGSGSSRDWAAKGPYLQGVRAVIAESYERIHRSNLVGMGILPLQYIAGQTMESLELSGEEAFDLVDLPAATAGGFADGGMLTVRARDAAGKVTEFRVRVRIDTPQELLYYRHGGILQYVLRQLLGDKDKPEAISRSLAASPQPAPEQLPKTNAVEEGSIESFPASDPPAY